MKFPFEFAKKSGDYDFFSPLINFTGNAAVVAGACVGVGLISYLALKALGFTSVAATSAAAVPVVAGAIAAGAAVLGIAALATITYMLLSAFSHR